jgi:hypothetical protein
MAGPYFDQAAAVALEKELYDDQRVRDFSYKDNPTFGLMRKNPDADGLDYPLPFIVSPGQGAGSNMQTAQANQSPEVAQAFKLTPASFPYYGIRTIARPTLLAMRKNRGAFITALETVTEGALRQITNDIAWLQFASGTGSRAAIQSISAGVITLAPIGAATSANALPTVFFEKNMVLQANPADGGPTPRAALGYVIAVNRQAGTITVSATSTSGSAGTPAGWVNGDFLLRQSDNNSVAPGMLGWLPAVAPASTDNWFGVNRSSETRLYGVYGNFAFESISEAFIDTAMLIDREGGLPTHAALNPISMGAFIKELSSKVTYEPMETPDSVVSFKGIRFYAAKGDVMVYADRSCPALTGFLLQMDTWEFASVTPAPHIQGLGDGEDESELFRVYNQDARELRASAYACPGCQMPGWNSQIALQQ